MKVVWTNNAYKDFKKLDSSIARRIWSAIEELIKNPKPLDIEKLKGIEGYRLRVGDYRIIFRINNDEIVLLKIGHRQNIYN